MKLNKLFFILMLVILFSNNIIPLQKVIGNSTYAKSIKNTCVYLTYGAKSCKYVIPKNNFMLVLDNTKPTYTKIKYSIGTKIIIIGWVIKNNIVVLRHIL